MRLSYRQVRERITVAGLDKVKGGDGLWRLCCAFSIADTR